MTVTAPDPVDLRLLAVLAESGRAAVHEIAAKVGIDPRDAAARLITLSANGVPLLVGAECDAYRLQSFVASQQQAQWAAAHSSAPQSALPPYPQHQFGPGPNYVAPQQQYPAPQSWPFPRQPVPQSPIVAPLSQQAPPSAPVPQQPPATPAAIWGPPQSAAWARSAAPAPTAGKIGDALSTTTPDGDQLTLRLLEVVDPADFLFQAAGHTLAPGERAVVAHTEVTNTGTSDYSAEPDHYLVLCTDEGRTVGKSTVTLSSRQPHGAGVRHGDTVGGHAVYVLGASSRVIEIRWMPRPGSPSLVWEL